MIALEDRHRTVQWLEAACREEARFKLACEVVGVNRADGSVTCFRSKRSAICRNADVSPNVAGRSFAVCKEMSHAIGIDSICAPMAPIEPATEIRDDSNLAFGSNASRSPVLEAAR